MGFLPQFFFEFRWKKCTSGCKTRHNFSPSLSRQVLVSSPCFEVQLPGVLILKRCQILGLSLVELRGQKNMSKVQNCVFAHSQSGAIEVGLSRGFKSPDIVGNHKVIFVDFWLFMGFEIILKACLFQKDISTIPFQANYVSNLELVDNVFHRLIGKFVSKAGTSYGPHIHQFDKKSGQDHSNSSVDQCL